MIVVIDTTRPHVELMSAPDRPGHAGVQWHISDDHLKASSLRVEYRQGRQSDWIPLTIMPRQSQSYWLAAGTEPIEVRAVARDLADNFANARIRVHAVPAPVASGDGSSAHGSGSSGRGGQARQGQARSVQSQPAHRSEPAPDADADLPQGAHILGSRAFDLSYRIEDVGPSGLSLVELWCSTDRGTTWQRVAEDTDKMSPITFAAPNEGLYGLTLVVKSGVGRGDTSPASGSTPQLWVLVDTTPPMVHLQSVLSGGAADDAHLQIRWTAFDRYPADNPITLEYSSDTGKSWKPIVKQTANAGNYTWRLPRDAGYRVMVRVTAIDRAGNRSVETMREPVVVDGSRPKGQLLAITPTSAGESAPVKTTGVSVARSVPSPAPATPKPTAPKAAPTKAKARPARPIPQAQPVTTPEASGPAPTIAPDADGRVAKAKKENRQGTYYRLRGDYEQAQKHLERAVSLWPEFAAAHNDLAGVYFIRADYARAERHYHQAIQLSKNDPTPHFGLAQVYVQQHNHVKAEHELNAVLKYDPEDLEAMVLLGQVHMRLFRTSQKAAHKEKAIWCWQQAIKSGDPGSTHVVQAKRSLRLHQ